MKITSLLSYISITSLAAVSTQAAIIFSQDFSTDNNVSSYVSESTPTSGQFNAISTTGSGVTASVTSGVLTYTRTDANAGSFSRTTDFSPTPSGISYKFDLTVFGNSAQQTTAAVFQVGSGFSFTKNGEEDNANTYARFGLNFTATDGTFQVRDIPNRTNSADFSGTQSVFWVLNNTGSSFNYTDPSAGETALADDTADLWLGTTKVLDGIAIQTPTQSITNLKFVFKEGTGSIGIDNIVINSIPESSAALLGAIGLLSLLRRRR